jgi:hypothetical protein
VHSILWAINKRDSRFGRNATKVYRSLVSFAFSRLFRNHKNLKRTGPGTYMNVHAASRILGTSTEAAGLRGESAAGGSRSGWPKRQGGVERRGRWKATARAVRSGAAHGLART